MHSAFASTFYVNDDMPNGPRRRNYLFLTLTYLAKRRVYWRATAMPHWRKTLRC